MRSKREEPAAASRARWMAELAAAIESAQRVAWQLGIGDHSVEARELYGRLEAARVELDALRRGARPAAGDIGPWLAEHVGWPGVHDDPAGS